MTELEWGITRGEFEPKLWKATATIDLEDAETKEKILDPTQIIDFKSIGDDVKNLISDAYHGSRTKATAKELLKNGAQIVATLLQTEIPSMPALALKAEWNDTVGTRSVLSDYSIAATAYKPLGFGFGAELGIDGRTISLDKIDAAVAKVINKIQDKANRLDLKLQNVNIDFSNVDPNNFHVYVHLVGTPVTGITINSTATGANEEIDFSNDIKAIIAAVPADALNDLVKEGLNVIADVNSYAERAKNLEVRVTNFLETYINKVILKIANDGLTRVLEPVMLYQGDKGVNRLATGAYVKAGAEIDLIPTTMTKEIFAPAYKKYVAVIGKDGKAKNPVVLTRGQKDFSKVTVKIEEGDQAIVYSALDFSGKQIAKKYAINVVK